MTTQPKVVTPTDDSQALAIIAVAVEEIAHTLQAIQGSMMVLSKTAIEIQKNTGSK